MSDPTLSGGGGDPAAPTPTPAPSPTPTPAPAADPAPPIVGGDPAAAPASPEPAAAWRQDWRETMAGDNAPFLTRLKRFATPENFAKSAFEADAKIRSGQYRESLPDAPTEEELAAHRTQHGIPATPDEYKLAWPESVKPTEAHTATLGGLKQAAHAAHMTPAQLDAMWGYYTAGTERAAQEQHDRLVNAEVETRAALRKEYGRDYVRFVGENGGPSLANEFLAEFWGTDGPAMMQWKLADGTTLGSHPEFIRGAVRAGLATASADRIVASESQVGGKTLDDQYKEMIAVNSSQKPEDKARAKTPEFQGQLNKLAEMRVARDERAGGRRVA